MYKKTNIDLSVDLCGVRFENPFVLAAAPPTDELEILRNGFKAGWAGAVLKTTSVEDNRVPLKYPMMTAVDYEGGKISALGNIDLISEHHIDKIEERVRVLKKEFPKKIVITSIMGSKKEDWQELVKRCAGAGADIVECSFSCPQGTLGSARPGAMLGQSVDLSSQVVTWLKEAASRVGRNLPVVIKLTPHVADITDIATAVKKAGADAVCVSNTFKALMGIDLDTWVAYPNVEGRSTYSGMSGPAVRPMVLRLIAEVSKKVGIPVTGSGGVVTWKDAAEFILCGAVTVQVCTAVMHYGFDIIEDLKEGLTDYLEKRGLSSAMELKGRALTHITSHDELTYKEKLTAKIDEGTCIKCGECYIACRDGGHMAIKSEADRKFIVDGEKCVACGLCRVVCPVADCISLEKK